MVTSSALSEHLRRRAEEYFADLRAERARVVLRRTRRRSNSTLREFVVGDGVAEHAVLVKTPSESSGKAGAAGGVERPRSFPIATEAQKGRFEFEAMAAIERHVVRLNDPRFDAVRMLELLPEEQAVVMEKVSDRSLSCLLLKTSCFTSYRARWQLLGRTMRNAGYWLRRYHALPVLEHTQPRGDRRAVFVESLQRVAGYLADVHGCRPIEHLACELSELAERTLPEALPLGLGHGDFAPRNVLVAPRGRIRVIDTMSRWESPIYEDIGYFLAMLKTSAPQMWSWGLAHRGRQMRWFERQFLKGYFEGQEVPLARVRLFEFHTLLERCAAAADRHQRLQPQKRLIKGAMARWASRFLTGQLYRLAGELRTIAADQSARRSGGVR